MKKELCIVIIGIVLSISCTSSNKTIFDQGRKYNPGHYVALNSGSINEIKYIDVPEIIGINKRYHWNELESKKNIYDFSMIRKDLEYLKSKNKQLIVFIQDKSYRKQGSLPNYLSEYEIKLKENDYGCIRWHNDVVDGWIRLTAAISKEFDSNPNFEGIAIQETALNLPEEVYIKYNYTADKYRDALVKILINTKTAFKYSNVFWYQNFIHENNGHLRQIADAIIKYEIFMGGPDILPYRNWIRTQSYPLYEEYKNKLVLFGSVQDCSYMHHKNDIRVSEIEPIHEDGYLEMDEIFQYGKDVLHLDYIFWNYFYEEPFPNVRSFDDSIKVIKDNSDYNNK